VTDDGLRQMVYETRQDVRWIKDTRRDGALAAIVSMVVAFFTALASGGWLR